MNTSTTAAYEEQAKQVAYRGAKAGIAGMTMEHGNMRLLNERQYSVFKVLREAIFGCVLATFAIADESPFFLHEGEAGFVVSHIEFALALDAEKTGACPAGMSLQVEEIFKKTPEGQRRQGESDEAYQQRLAQGSNALSTSVDGKNVCMHPELWGPDPHYRSVEGSDIPVWGIPLGGVESFGSNPDLRFPSMEGEEQIENQFYRAVGCLPSFQSRGQSNHFAIGMLTGSWGIVISLSDVDDINNDDYVEVGIYANGDPIQVSPSRDPLSYATYAIKEDPRFHAFTHGRIEGGVLTTEPVDILILNEVNQMYIERPLHDARLRMTLSQEGVLEGYISGYSPVEELYDFQFGYRSAYAPEGGELRPGQPQGSANGAALVLGHTCHGVYHGLYEHADGHPDPETGQFTSITQYKIEAIPAFVVDMAKIRAERDLTRQSVGSE